MKFNPSIRARCYYAGLLGATLMLAACKPNNTWRPSPASPTSAAPPTAASTATLIVESFDVRRRTATGGYYAYQAEAVLRETTGASAARLRSIVLTPAGDNDGTEIRGDEPGARCFSNENSKVIGAGASWDLASLPQYCSELIDNDIAGLSVALTVAFTDEAGRPGQVQATTIARK